MSMYNVVFYCCLCLICQTSSQITVNTDVTYIQCENEREPGLTCPTTQIIYIKDAIYGRTNSYVCLDDSVKSNEPYSCEKPVTSIVASNCSFVPKCLPSSSNKLYSDPCFGLYKYLNVTYKCIEVIPPVNYRMISFKTVNETTDWTLPSFNKCVNEEPGFLKFKVKSCDDVNITMVDSLKRSVDIIINEKNSTVIYERYKDKIKKKAIISNSGVNCNMFSNLVIKWNMTHLKFGIFFGIYMEIMFEINFKIHDIHLSSVLKADWIFFEKVSDSTNNVEVAILPNWASPTLLCHDLKKCNEQPPTLPVIPAKESSKCEPRMKIEIRCTNGTDEMKLSYRCKSSGFDQTELTNKGCKDIIRISACQGTPENKTCDKCTYFNIRIEVNTTCSVKPVPLVMLRGKHCKNFHEQLSIWHEIRDAQQPLKSSTHLPTPFTASPSSSSTDAQPPLKSSTHLPLFTASPSSSSKTEQQVSFSITGLAVGISASVAVIIIIACVLIILRKRKRSPEKQSTQKYANDQDYIGTQNIAMPRSGDSPEYNDLKVRRESHKYGELKSVSEATGDSCYDVIDANEHTRETKVFSVEQGTFQNDSSSRSCQEYAMLNPSEKRKTELNTSSYWDTGCDHYTVLEAEEARINHSVNPPTHQFDKGQKTYQTKNNEKTMEVTSAHNATREDYAVLDPKLTEFNRMNHNGNNKLLEKKAIFNPNIRDMEHDTTHPLKEDTKYYELAKPVDEDGKENTFHKYDGDYGFCQDSDYNQLKAEHPKYSEEHVYNHTVDDVYDTTSHNRKCATPDNTYDYFCGDKTDDHYNIPMKM